MGVGPLGFCTGFSIKSSVTVVKLCKLFNLVSSYDEDTGASLEDTGKG